MDSPMLHNKQQLHMISLLMCQTYMVKLLFLIKTRFAYWLIIYLKHSLDILYSEYLQQVF